MSDVQEARHLARAANLLDAFHRIAEGEYTDVVVEALVSLLAETLASHPDRQEMLEHVIEHLPSIVEDIASGKLEERGYLGSA